ncbi:SH3 domain-containing YSC84-like protein 1 [Mizuhopecten yessoensis]|uniref:SH3 domain-containing YSC84-like protein 1 n=1 Tax=Mizuhopecten yessoensis TaxID=6573 RepID=UPI000B45C87A|nr:SH3 domain-containing YSC84-like protein 1 [Mizuhopecten yessoensis]
MVNTPIPHSLRSEAKKAAKILRGFTVPTASMGPDKLIPAGILVKAKGLAILTVFKAGFLVTARGGSGIVIAKVGDDLDAEWSAPSALGIAGLGGGFEIGAEVTDFVIILNSHSSVEAFSKGGNLTLGGNFSIAAGPLGRNLEADVALRSPAAIYTYSKTKGLFAGISVEGSALIERKDANKKFYGQDIRAHQILSGEVPRPEECSALYETLEMHRKQAEKQMLDMAKKAATKQAHTMGEKLKSRFSSTKSRSARPGSDDSMSKYSLPASSSHYSQDSSDEESSNPMDRYSLPKSHSRHSVSEGDFSESKYSLPKSSDPGDKYSMPESRSRSQYNLYGGSELSTDDPMSKFDLPFAMPRAQSCRSVRTVTQHSSTNGGSKTVVKRTVQSRTTRTSSKGSEVVTSQDAWSKVNVTPGRGIANFAYESQLPCDISFRKGEEILILTRTQSTDDWWEGTCRGKTGIFPANYITVK